MTGVDVNSDANPSEGVVTDADLDQAAAAVADKPEDYVEDDSTVHDDPPQDPGPDPDSEPPKEPDDDQLPKEPDDNRERSQLGRRVSTIEQNFDKKLDAFKQEILSALKPSESDDDDLDDSDGETILTKREVEELFQKQQQKAKQRDKNYLTEVQRELVKYGNQFGDETEMFDAVIKEIETNHTLEVSDDPKGDAEKLYLRAKVAVMSKQAANPVKDNPLKGKEPRSPLGAGASSTTDTQVPQKIKLDPVAEKYVKQMGLTEEQVKEALAGDDFLPSGSTV